MIVGARTGLRRLMVTIRDGGCGGEEVMIDRVMSGAPMAGRVRCVTG